MSDSARCRAIAAHYARLADASHDADTRIAYLELERLWLETASWTDKLHLGDHDNARRRIFELIDLSGSCLKEVRVSVH